MPKLPRLVGKAALLVMSCLLATATIHAGTISLAWDPVPGATGYRVYYGNAPGQYTQNVTVSSNSATLSSLQDCRDWYVAVKALNGAGESVQFSNELRGWPRPEVTSASPATAKQGDQIVVDLTGKNFQSGATVNFGDPPRERLYQASVAVTACDRIQLLLTVEPTARNIPPARAEKLTIEVVNPDSVFGQRSNSFEVVVNPARFDVNQSDEFTNGAIDGKDLVWLLRVFRSQATRDSTYDPDYDFDGDGWVDGNDLAYIASNFGLYWSGAAWTAQRPR